MAHTERNSPAILDRLQISEVFYRYAMGLDFKNVALFRGCFADRVDLDFSGTKLNDGALISDKPADKWAEEAIKGISGHAVSQHFIVPYRIEVEGNLAHTIAYLLTNKVLVENDRRFYDNTGGFYTVTMERDGTEWKICRWKLNWLWTEKFLAQTVINADHPLPALTRISDPSPRTVLDRMEIEDIYHRYGTGMDRRDLALYRSSFADRLHIDWTGTTLFGREIWPDKSADEFAATAINGISTFHHTQHLIVPYWIDVRGDEARTLAYLIARQRMADPAAPSFDGGGFYTNRFVRTKQGWRIADLKLTLTWGMNFDVPPIQS